MLRARVVRLLPFAPLRTHPLHQQPGLFDRAVRAADVEIAPLFRQFY